MAAVAKGDFDSLFDKINETLTDYSDALETLKFNVEPDFYRIPQGGTGAFVFSYFAGLSNGKKAGQIGNLEFTANYILDLFAVAEGTKGTESAERIRADKAAGLRLRYLIVQVLDAIYHNSNDEDIRALSEPSFSVLPPERLEQMGERAFSALRMTFSVRCGFVPSELSGTDLEVITATADLWSAYIEPETREE